VNDLLTDQQLLRDYAANRSEAAFSELVRRHVDLVYSAARRMVGDSHQAQDVTQAVFMALAQNAGKLTDHPVLSGWLHRTTQNLAANAVRANVRRQIREQEAAAMNELLPTAPDVSWEQIAPHLDTALGELADADRDAVLLRYFERKSATEMAQILGVSDEAAQKRVSRAVERLREYFAKRGVTIGAGGLVAVVSANAVQAAPAGLVLTISTAAALGGTAVTTTATATVTKAIAMTTLQKAIITGTITVLAGVGISASLKDRQTVQSNEPIRALQSQQSSVESKPDTSMPTVIREFLAETTMFTLDSPPGSVAIQPDGKILVGSVLFGALIDEQSGRLGFYNRIALRLNSDGSLDRTFLGDATRNDSSSFVAHLEVAADGRILVTGSFNAVEGNSRPGLALLKPDGALDLSFQPWRDRTNAPGQGYVPSGVYPAALLTNGSVALVTSSLEGARTPYPTTVYQLNATGDWIAPTNNLVGGEFFRPSGLIRTLEELGFWARRAVDWTRSTPNPSAPVGELAFDRRPSEPTAYDAAKVLRALFEEVPMELCRYAVRLPTGGAILAIRDNASPTSPGRLMRFDSDWKPDLSFTNQYEADQRSRITLVRQPDGRLLVGGLVGRINGQDASGVMRLEADGQIDRGFRCAITNAPEGCVMGMALQADGRIVICGFFSVVNGVEVPHIARLNPDGSLDTTFHPPFMTREQFNRARFGKRLTVPVARANPSAAPPTDSGPAAANQSSASQTIIITSLSFSGDMAQVWFTGVPNHTYILQAKDALESLEWSNISTNRTSPAGDGVLRDSDASKNPRRFYRIAQP
jgi:RNA polymerase sigma factor (sigma-70 family)